MSELPSGTVTFVFTDIEGSTRMLRDLGDEGYAAVLAEHRRQLREVFAAHQGSEIDTQGDAFFYVFRAAAAAARAAVTIQQLLAGGPVRVRMGLHTGEPLLTSNGYIGMEVHRAARIAACGHGGQVLLSERTRELLPEALSVRDLGMHRLKDLQDYEHLFQLGDHEFPPLKSLNQSNLPIQPTTFVGRERELHELLELMRRNEMRVLTLTGTGGSGKTRLALQAAAELVSHYPHGVWFVSLASLTDEQLVAAHIGRTLGIRLVSGESWEGTVSRHLEFRHLLLVIDNAEHLLPEAARQIGAVTARAGRARVLVTSREPLRIAAECELPLAALSAEDAVTLFTERVRLHVPAFVVSESDRAVVRAICEQLDRLPLAIELAAAWVRALSPRELLARLEHRLALLTGGGRDAPERQQTLQATIAWSYDLLTPDQQDAFIRLSVFAGGCTVDAAETVCATRLPTLASLIDKSLVRIDRDEDASRYLMLETIREFARDRLQERGDSANLAHRHFQYYSDLAERAALEVKGANQRSWLRRLEAEHDNLRAALRWGLEQGSEDDALRLAAALWMFWSIRGYVAEGRNWLTQSLRASSPRATAVRATALDGAAYLAHELGDMEAAMSLAEESLDCARESGGVSEAAMAAAHLCGYEQNLERAEALASEALALARRAGDRYAEALALSNLGVILRMTRDLNRATEAAEAGYRIRRELDVGLPGSLILLGELALLSGDVERAQATLSEALETARAVGDRRYARQALEDLGYVELASRSFDSAEDHLRESLRMAKALYRSVDAYTALCGLAATAAARRDCLRAARLAAAAEHQKPRDSHLGSASIAETGLHLAELAAARSECGDATWGSEWRRGSALTADEAIAYALATEGAE